MDPRDLIQNQRAINRAQQQQAISSKPSSIYRIGERDSTTGQYDVIYPDGSTSPNGIKAYNTKANAGDVVLATPRPDGTIALESTKANANERKLPMSPLKDNCNGYIRGQVFNCKKPDPAAKILLIRYAWTSPSGQIVGNLDDVILIDGIPPDAVATTSNFGGTPEAIGVNLKKASPSELINTTLTAFWVQLLGGEYFAIEISLFSAGEITYADLTNDLLLNPVGRIVQKQSYEFRPTETLGSAVIGTLSYYQSNDRFVFTPADARTKLVNPNPTL